jgi:hypothetical protein
MSKRHEADVSARAALRASHLAQIDALTRPGLSPIDRVVRFGDAADLPLDKVIRSLADLVKFSPARAVWQYGDLPMSLFANLPGCRCPVIECCPGVTHDVTIDWTPTAEELEVFSAIQLDRRFPE